MRCSVFLNIPRFNPAFYGVKGTIGAGRIEFRCERGECNVNRHGLQTRSGPCLGDLEYADLFLKISEYEIHQY